MTGWNSVVWSPGFSRSVPKPPELLGQKAECLYAYALPGRSANEMRLAWKRLPR